MGELLASLSVFIIIFSILFPIIVFLMFWVLCSNVGRIRKMIFKALRENKIEIGR